MLKNGKIFVFLVVLFSVIILFSSSVFASTDNYSFTGFDGNTYNLPSLPDGVNNYNHYVIIKSEPWFHIFCFNESLEITHGGGFLTLNPDNDTTGKRFTCSDSSTWTEYGNEGIFSFSGDSLFINSCIDLVNYADQFNSGEDFFYNPPTVEVEGVLAPIIQETPLEGVLQEIVEILPIVLVTIVGLIGLRKALQMLLAVLHRS